MPDTTLTEAKMDSSGGMSTDSTQLTNWPKPAVWVTTPPKPITAAVLSSGMMESSAPCPSIATVLRRNAGNSRMAVSVAIVRARLGQIMG